jgi:serine/threonine protein kinase
VDHFGDANAEPLAPTVRAKAVLEVALTMRYMHSCGVCHRGLKPGKLLFDHRSEIRVADR